MGEKDGHGNTGACQGINNVTLRSSAQPYKFRLHKIALTGRARTSKLYSAERVYATRLILPRPKLLPDVTTHRGRDVQARQYICGNVHNSSLISVMCFALNASTNSKLYVCERLCPDSNRYCSSESTPLFKRCIN